MAPSGEGDRFRFRDARVEPVGPCHRWNRADWEQPEQDDRTLVELVEHVKQTIPWKVLVPSPIQSQGVADLRVRAGTHAVGSC